MLRGLFDGTLQSRHFIIDCLSQYASSVKELEFPAAVACINDSLTRIQVCKNSANNSSNEIKLNQIYIASTYLSMLRDYSIYWSNVLEHNFSESWNILQNIQDRFRVLKRYCKDLEIGHLDLIEDQIVTLEKIYPYKVFVSPELVISDIRCSICGRDMNNFDCPHISGELYGGERAYGIVGKIEQVNAALALVEHPLDKRCVVELADTPMNFPILVYLAGLINEQQISPWQFSGVRQSKRRKQVSEFGKVGRNDRCPCGSGKKFKMCCAKNDYIEIPHIDILLSETTVPVFKIAGTA